MITARFLPAARLELLAAVDFYDQHMPGLGMRFTIAVEDAAARAMAFPLAGTRTTDRTRKAYLRGEGKGAGL